MKRLLPALFALLLAAAAQAREFSSQIISSTNALCRAPVGDADFVVWQQFAVDNGLVLGSDIVLWTPSAGVSNLTASATEIAGRSKTPAVCGQSVAFTALYSKDAAQGPDFTLEMPDLTPEMKAMEDEYPTLFGKPAPPAATVQEMAEEGEPAPENPEETPDPAKAPRVAPGENWRAARGDGTSIALWQNGVITRLTPDTYTFQLPVLSDNAVAAICPRGWPYGYELVAVDRANPARLMQLTTNFFYVQSPRIHGTKLVYQAWDGNDNEIFLADLSTGEITQITDNTFDDTEPDVWEDTIVWTAHPVTSGEIFAWRSGSIRKVSQSSVDNSRPAVWDGHVVWQGMASDGDNFDIFYNDGSRTVKLTSNVWDDLNPVIRNGVVAWESSVDLGDPEIMALDLSDKIPVQLSDSAFNDHSPAICGECVAWQTDTGETSYIQLATPTSPRAEPKPAEEDGAAAN
jgi:hypothetical protein